LTKNRIIGYNIRRKLDGLQPKVYAMAAAAATFVHMDTHAHDRVDDAALYGWDADHDFFSYVGEISDGDEDGCTYDVNALHPDSEEQMPSSHELLAGLLPGDSTCADQPRDALGAWTPSIVASEDECPQVVHR
jgi:hypothetical protein